MKSVRRLRRPETEGTPAFDLAYVRTGPPSATPLVVIPGGPGLASLLPYRALRRWAARGGLDVIMIEHRGVGSSRSDTTGRDLPKSSMWITEVVDDIAAVLDRERVDTAHLVGSSYGSYLASAFGARHPARVAGMILDSPLQTADIIEFERRAVRKLLWDADTPVARGVRRLSEPARGERHLLETVRAAYELGGAELLESVVSSRLAGVRSPVWTALELYAARDESIPTIPRFYEFQIAGTIGFRELGYGAPTDGRPLDPAVTYAHLAGHFPAFAGEPFDLLAETADFPWPIVVLIGEHDLRTPPAAALRTVHAARDPIVVRIRNGHSALETHPAVVLNAMRHLVAGSPHRLAALSDRLDRLPRVGLSARFGGWLRTGARLVGHGNGAREPHPQTN